ncbi:MAG: TolC family protein [Bacteroidetes bacterium]|nr:TolC family protein [Bacteroidota bacterium]
MKIFFLIISFSFILGISANAQETIKILTYEDVINIAKNQSPDGLVAKNKYLGSYWKYRSYKASYMPMLSLDATLPNINRSISKIPLADGSQTFIEQRSTDYTMKLSLSKTIGLTGGQLFINSGIERLDVYRDSTITSFLSNPITIGFRQPLFNYNPYRWERKIEPILYDEARQQYLEDQEELSIKATNLYFDLLDAQIRANIAKINQANNDTLYKIAQGRYNLGKIAENELLQLELSLLNSNLQVEQTRNDVEVTHFKLKSFLGMRGDEKVELQIPKKVFDFKIDASKAIAEARSNNSESISYQRKLLEAKSAVNKAKLENRFNANIYALYGLTQSAIQFAEVYKNPLDQQQLSLGIQIPILDWGLARAKIKMAKSNEELINTQVSQQKIDFDQQILIKVMQFNMQYSQLKIAAKADTIGEKRFNVTKARYMIGKVDITELNIAMTEKDRATQDYIAALRSFWNTYYEIRRLTLYDFVANKLLNVDFDSLH